MVGELMEGALLFRIASMIAVRSGSALQCSLQLDTKVFAKFVSGTISDLLNFIFHNADAGYYARLMNRKNSRTKTPCNAM